MPYDPKATRPLGRSPIGLPQLGFGTAPLGGNLRSTSAADAAAAIDAAWGAGLRYFDTAPQYGHGLAEHRVGTALGLLPRHEFLLSTKVGRLLRPRGAGPRAPTSFVDTLPFEIHFDYGHDATLRSLDDSMQRLGMDRIDMVMIHDVSPKFHGDQVDQRFKEAMSGSYRALDRLRGEGTIKAFGVGMNDCSILARFAEAGDFDYFMVAGRYTLLEQDALIELLPICERRRIGILMAAPFNSGILATGATEQATFHYLPASAEVAARTRRIEAVCRDHDVALGAAALQFPLGHPAVTSVVTGLRTPKEVNAAVSLLQAPIPTELWRDLQRQNLLPRTASLPH